ncbi:hypothetical protein JWG44_03230 [Leptospira sp. 201903071]|uniref:hypothetical protein n=1 Tax=Leptospira ainazelensis TaxID=2810034 RepID=UPI0019663529|nr:hypothetical protein [Leptospira ainazelensis]MBM9499263.1 hypothetical protein [Leptospira ainazelensis]
MTNKSLVCILTVCLFTIHCSSASDVVLKMPGVQPAQATLNSQPLNEKIGKKMVFDAKSKDGAPGVYNESDAESFNRSLQKTIVENQLFLLPVKDEKGNVQPGVYHTLDLIVLNHLLAYDDDTCAGVTEITYSLSDPNQKNLFTDRFSVYTNGSNLGKVKSSLHKGIIYRVLKDSIATLNKTALSKETNFEEAVYFPDVHESIKRMPVTVNKTECAQWTQTQNGMVCVRNNNFTETNIDWKKFVVTTFPNLPAWANKKKK